MKLSRGTIHSAQFLCERCKVYESLRSDERERISLFESISGVTNTHRQGVYAGSRYGNVTMSYKFMPHCSSEAGSATTGAAKVWSRLRSTSTSSPIPRYSVGKSKRHPR